MLQELNKDAALLMYLADELSPADRAKVNAMLASDPALQKELQQLEETVQGFGSAMMKLDAGPVAGEAETLRRVGKAMRQRMVDRAVETAPAIGKKPRGLRYPAWAYPIGAAAAVIIAVISWWGHRPDTTVKLPSMGNGIAVNNTMPEEEVRQVATDMEKSFEETNMTQPETSVASLETAEAQLAELSRSSEAGAPDLGFSDGQ